MTALGWLNLEIASLIYRPQQSAASQYARISVA